jgi:hypothetical protein
MPGWAWALVGLLVAGVALGATARLLVAALVEVFRTP